jgi:hypothetical protein
MDNFIILKTYNTRMEAELVKGKLNLEGVDSFIEADDGGGIIPHLLNGTGFVKLKINKKYFKRATELLKKYA